MAGEDDADMTSAGQERTVLVTGSSRGIGRAVALELARAGWSVAVHGRSAAGAAEVARLLAAEGKHAGTFLADLAVCEGAERLAAVAVNSRDLSLLECFGDHPAAARPGSPAP